MHKNKDINGYTIIEILATIVILGVLSSLGIVAINNVIVKMHENHFKAQEKAIVMATKSYSEDNKAILPKKIGEKTIVTIKELQKSKYLGQVLQYDKKECAVGYVTIFKYDKDLYTYKPYLKCPNLETNKNEYGGEGPQISIQTDNDIKNPTFSFTLVAEEKTKIIGYEYIVFKYGVEALNSGSVATSKTSKVEKKNISLKDIAPGQFKILVKATNNYGITNTKTVELKVMGTNGPICGEISPVIKTWHNNSPTTISVKCIDKGGSGCKQDVFTKNFTYNSKKNFIEIEDNNGKKTNCLVDTYLDNLPPSKPIITNIHHNVWFNDEYKITAESEDKISGLKCIEYKYDDGTWVELGDFTNKYVEKYKFEIEIPKKNNNQILSVRTKDRAGNYSDISTTMIKIDIDKPEKIMITNSNNDKWVNNNYNINLKYIDNYSGIKNLQYRYSGEEWKDYSGISNTPNIIHDYETELFTKEMNKKYQVRACDYANNCSNISQTIIKIDKTPPQIEFTTDTGPHHGSIDVYSSCTDALSKVKTKSSKTHISAPANGKTITHTCKDKAGNVSTVTDDFYVKVQRKKCTTSEKSTSVSCETCACSCPKGYTMTGCSMVTEKSNTISCRKTETTCTTYWSY